MEKQKLPPFMSLTGMSRILLSVTFLITTTITGKVNVNRVKKYCFINPYLFPSFSPARRLCHFQQTAVDLKSAMYSIKEDHDPFRASDLSFEKADKILQGPVFYKHPVAPAKP